MVFGNLGLGNLVLIRYLHNIDTIITIIWFFPGTRYLEIWCSLKLNTPLLHWHRENCNPRNLPAIRVYCWTKLFYMGNNCRRLRRSERHEIYYDLHFKLLSKTNQPNYIKCVTLKKEKHYILSHKFILHYVKFYLTEIICFAPPRQHVSANQSIVVLI
jgi:hypothetical protein